MPVIDDSNEELQGRELEYICGNCGYHETTIITCGVKTGWHEQIKCKNCGEIDLIQFQFTTDEEKGESLTWDNYPFEA
jgi:uncharacterized Zn finger protein